MSDSERTVVVTIEPGSDPIAGRGRDPAGSAIPFVGYVELIAQLERYRQADGPCPKTTQKQLEKHMYARVMTWRNAKNIDDGVSYLRDKAGPVASGLAGYRGGAASADRAGGIFSVLTLWETEKDREASFAALSAAREEATRIVGGDLTVENFEDAVAETGPTPPTVGAALQVRPVSMDPARVDENIAFFKSTVLPRITASPGFQSLHNMIDRKTGRGSVGSAWAGEASMRAAIADAESRRQEAADRGVTLGEASYREILYVDFP